MRRKEWVGLIVFFGLLVSTIGVAQADTMSSSESSSAVSSSESSSSVSGSAVFPSEKDNNGVTPSTTENSSIEKKDTKQQAKLVQVKVKYRTQFGMDLGEDTLRGHIGEYFTAKAVDFESKDYFLSSPKEVTGIFKNKNAPIVFVYKVPVPSKFYSLPDASVDIIKYGDNSLKYITIGGHLLYFIDFYKIQKSEFVTLVTDYSLYDAKGKLRTNLREKIVPENRIKMIRDSRFTYLSTEFKSFILEKDPENRRVRVYQVNNETGDTRLYRYDPANQGTSLQDFLSQFDLNQSDHNKLVALLKQLSTQSATSKRGQSVANDKSDSHRTQVLPQTGDTKAISVPILGTVLLSLTLLMAATGQWFEKRRD